MKIKVLIITIPANVRGQHYVDNIIDYCKNNGLEYNLSKTMEVL